MNKIHELEKQLEAIRAELEKLKQKEQKQKPIKWLPEMGQEYYFCYSDGVMTYTYWNDSDSDHYRRNHVGIFPTAEDFGRWYRIDAVIREACGEAVEVEDLFVICGTRDNRAFTEQIYPSGYDISFRYWTNNPNAADEINAKLTEDDRRWFLTGGRG